MLVLYIRGSCVLAEASCCVIRSTLALEVPSRAADAPELAACYMMRGMGVWRTAGADADPRRLLALSLGGRRQQRTPVLRGRSVRAAVLYERRSPQPAFRLVATLVAAIACRLLRRRTWPCIPARRIPSSRHPSRHQPSGARRASSDAASGKGAATHEFFVMLSR